MRSRDLSREERVLESENLSHLLALDVCMYLFVVFLVEDWERGQQMELDLYNFS